MPSKVPCRFEVENKHEVVDGICTDEVVTELVDIKCRPRKSRDVLQRCVAQGNLNIGDRWSESIDAECLGVDQIW